LDAKGFSDFKNLASPFLLIIHTWFSRRKFVDEKLHVFSNMHTNNIPYHRKRGYPKIGGQELIGGLDYNVVLPAMLRYPKISS
jgi:hypothetical protein